MNESDAGFTALAVNLNAAKAHGLSRKHAGQAPSSVTGLRGHPKRCPPLPQGERTIPRMCVHAEPEVDRDNESDRDLAVID